MKDWVLSSPEPPEFKKMFLIQLAWADQLNSEELNKLLTEYENEIRMQILLQKEKRCRDIFSPDRTSREKYLWDMIYGNIVSSYKNELNWIQKLCNELISNIEEETGKMDYELIEKNNKKYLKYLSDEIQLYSEQDALNFITACFENDTSLLMFHTEVLSDDFLKLKTGLAGQVLQKFINYHIRVAVILTDKHKVKGKFKELLHESSKGKDFRVFDDIVEAEKWLLT